MKKTISIPEWHCMAMEGDAPPVRITLNGNSMFPLVRWNRDYVTITPLNGEIVVGDIVLFNEPGTGRYVVHRVWEIENDNALTWGDHCDRPDGWISESCIWGKVSLVERGKRQIKPNPKRGLRWAKFWHKAGRVYRKLGRWWHRLIDKKEKS
ncbi:MAG: hypothetical protein IKW90_13070 [Lachnospiraceae bacterium]|nr:hypothetical protein [Lachnospiraceae bacterium]